MEEKKVVRLVNQRCPEKLDNMSTKGYIPPQLDESALKALVLEALENVPELGRVETYHARFDHLERGLSVDDVIHGLERDWSFDRPPEFNEDEWQWKYRIATEAIDGDEIVICDCSRYGKPIIRGCHPMEMTKNHDCKTARTEKFATPEEPFHFIDSGLPNVYLVGIKYFVCECGSIVAEIPAIKQLMQLIARDIVTSPLDLTGAEIRFLRKRIGKKAAEYSTYLGVAPETLSRFENGKQTISLQAQKLARLSYCVYSEDSNLAECARTILQSILEEIKDKHKKANIVLEMDTNQEWRELEAA